MSPNTVKRLIRFNEGDARLVAGVFDCRFVFWNGEGGAMAPEKGFRSRK